MRLTLTSGCSISNYRFTDHDAILENLSDGAVQPWCLAIPFPYTVENAARRLADVVPQAGQIMQKYNWAIRDERERHIGAISFLDLAQHQESMPAFAHTTEIGYWLAKRWWGKGIMTEAVRAVCDYAFQELGVHRVTAGIFAGNARSARVLEKAGFTLETPLMRKCYFKNGEYLDAVGYALVR
jgi:RimJ/RimL family protein N-acetyltransferase